MEITVNITGLDKMAEAITMLAQAGTSNIVLNGAKIADAVRVPAEDQSVAVSPAEGIQQNTTVPTANPGRSIVANMPQVQNAQSVSATQSAPATPVAQNTVPTVNPVPTTAATTSYTMEQLAVAATGLIDAGKMQEVQKAMTTLGAQTLMDLPKEKYGEFASAIRAIGAVI